MIKIVKESRVSTGFQSAVADWNDKACCVPNKDVGNEELKKKYKNS